MFKLPNNSAQTLTIWDSDSICILKPEQLVLWRQFVDSSHDKTTVSICELIEQNSTNLRARLLRFIYDVGSSITANSKTNHEFRSGFDYFWMTQFHSRPYTPSAQLNNLAKVFSSEMCQFVTDEAIQIFGGMGLMDELPLERMWRDTRVDRIWDGTSEIQRHIISRSLLRPYGG